MKKIQPNTTEVSTRDFVRDFKDIVQTDASTRYVVTRYGVPVGIYTPLPKTQLPSEEMNSEYEAVAEKRTAFSDLLAARFHSGEQNLSAQVDQIVYGISREEREKK